jgi:hypothetical protein
MKFGLYKFCSNAVRSCSTSLLAQLLVSLTSTLPNALTSLQPTFTMRTSGHCLGTFITENLSLFPPLNVVSLSTLPLCLFSYSFGLQGLNKWHYFAIKSGFVCISTDSRGGILWTRWWTFGFHSNREFHDQIQTFQWRSSTLESVDLIDGSIETIKEWLISQSALFYY